jgi:hypothetical protein
MLPSYWQSGLLKIHLPVESGQCLPSVCHEVDAEGNAGHSQYI